MEPLYMVIETDDGLTVVPHDPSHDPAETAAECGGVLTDGELYKTYDDAYDALLAMQAEADDEEAGGIPE